MGDKNILIWLLLGVVFVGAALWHVRENRQLARKWRGDLDAVSAEGLVRFAWGRTAQLLFALACCILVIVVYDWQLTATRHALTTLTTSKEEVHRQPPQNTVAKERSPAQPPQAAAPAANNANNGYYPPLVAQPAPAAIPAAAAPQSPPPVASNNSAGSVPPVLPVINNDVAARVDNSAPTPSEEPEQQQSAIGPVGFPQDNQTVDDVYNPEKKSNGNESAMDDIKKRYEDILVTYMFMKKCGKNGAGDYPVIISALAQEMASVNAPGRMQYDIITAAQGSYKEMYSQSPCDGQDIATLSRQYADYIKTLSNNLPAQ